MLAAELLPGKVLENMFHISHQRNGGTCVFTDLRRIHINVHQHLVPGNQIRLAHRPVCHSGAGHDQQIRLIHGPVGICLAMIAHHTEIQGMLRGHDADAHHGGHHRNPIFLYKIPQFVSGPAEQHAAPHADDGAFCPLQFFDHLFDLYRMALHRGLIGAHIDFRRVLKPAQSRILNVDGYVDQHGPLAACVGDMKSLFENPGNVVHILDQVTVLHKRLHRAGNVRLLEGIAAQQIRMYLPGNAHQGNAVREGGGNTGNHIGGAGTAGYRADPGPARKPGHAAGRMGRVLFRADQNGLNLRLQDTVIKGADGYAGVSEYIFHALFFQTFNYGIRTYHINLLKAS